MQRESLGTRVGAIIGGVFCLILFLMVWGASSSGPSPAPSEQTPNENVAAPTSDDLEKTKEGLAAAMQDPRKVAMMECEGIRVYDDPQPPGHPPSAPECALIEQLAGMLPKAGESTYPDIRIHNRAYNSDMPANDRAAVDGYEQHRLTAMNNLHIVYFAAGCGAFSAYGPGNATVVVFPYFMLTEQTLGQASLENEIGDAGLHESLKTAGQAGADDSQKPGACDYWKQHPDDMLPVRQEVEAARAVAASQ